MTAVLAEAREPPTASIPISATNLAKFCHSRHDDAMTTMNISLPGSLKAFVDAEVDRRGFGTSSEYIRTLIRREQEQEALRALLLEGAASPIDAAANDEFFAGLRDQVRSHRAK